MEHRNFHPWKLALLLALVCIGSASGAAGDLWTFQGDSQYRVGESIRACAAAAVTDPRLTDPDGNQEALALDGEACVSWVFDQAGAWTLTGNFTGTDQDATFTATDTAEAGFWDTLGLFIAPTLWLAAMCFFLARNALLPALASFISLTVEFVPAVPWSFTWSFLFIALMVWIHAIAYGRFQRLEQEK